MPVDRSFLNGWVDDDGSGVVGTVWNKARVGEMCDGIDNGAYVGAWTAYTPTWKTTGDPQPTVGVGSITGEYIRIGKLVHFEIMVQTAGGATFGNGAWKFSLPPLPVAGAFPYEGRGISWITSGGQFFLLGTLFGYFTVNEVTLAVNNAGHAAQGNPTTFPAGCAFHIGGWYRTS